MPLFFRLSRCFICVICSYFSYLSHTLAQVAKSDLMQVIGEVIDEKSNKPIPFAHIFVKDTNRKAISNAKGVFTISLYKSDIVVVASFGYVNRAFFIDNQSIKADKIFVKVFLEPNINMLKNVVIWGLTKENFKQAFINDNISKEDLYPIKISVSKDKIYGIPETGIRIGIDDLLKSLPLIKDIKQNSINKQRHNEIIQNEAGSMPALSSE